MKKTFAIANRNGDFYKPLNDKGDQWCLSSEDSYRYTRYECLLIIMMLDMRECWHICDGRKFLPYSDYYLDLVREYDQAQREIEQRAQEEAKKKKRRTTQKPVQLYFNF